MRERLIRRAFILLIILTCGQQLWAQLCQDALTADRVQIEAAVYPEKGYSNPFAKTSDQRIVFRRQNVHIADGYEKKDSSSPSRPEGVVVSYSGDDMLIEADLRGNKGGAAVEIPHIAGQVDTVVLKSDASRFTKTFNPFMRFPDIPMTSEVTFGQVEMLKKWAEHFYGFGFIAESSSSSEWKLIVTTDVSESRGSELGGVMTYEAAFSAPVGSANYVNLTLANFMPYLNGKPLEGEPGLGSAEYPGKVLKLRSMAFRAESAGLTGKANLRLRNSEVGMGFFYGLNADQAAEAVVEAIESTAGRNHKEAAKVFGNMILKMKRKLQNFPAGEAFRKLKTDDERRAFLNEKLGKIIGYKFAAHTGNEYIEKSFPYAVDPVIPRSSFLTRSRYIYDGKVDIQTVWSTVAGSKIIPTETGYFGSIHGKYTHALQFIAMFDDATEEEIKAVEPIFGRLEDFVINWNLAVDCRTGDANDPSAWRQLYEPTLPEK